MLQDESTSCMPKLMHSDTESGRFLDTLDDLRAERNLFLMLAALTREQPVRVTAAQQGRTEVIHILVNVGGYGLVERKLELHRVSFLVAPQAFEHYGADFVYFLKR